MDSPDVVYADVGINDTRLGSSKTAEMAGKL